MICTTLLAAQSVVIDKSTNRVSVLNIAETASSSLFPIPMPVTFFAIYEREPDESPNYDLILKGYLNGKNILNFPFKLNFIQDNVRHNSYISFSGITIPAVGKFEFSVECNGTELKRTYMNIVEKK